MSSFSRATLVQASFIAFIAGSAAAGPCSDEIKRAQIELDARIAANIKTAPAAAESVDATMHRQPTPASVARAGKEGHEVEAATALERARKADANDDRAECRSALENFHNLMN